MHFYILLKNYKFITENLCKYIIIIIIIINDNNNN